MNNFRGYIPSRRGFRGANRSRGRGGFNRPTYIPDQEQVTLPRGRSVTFQNSPRGRGRSNSRVRPQGNNQSSKSLQIPGLSNTKNINLQNTISPVPFTVTFTGKELPVGIGELLICAIYYHYWQQAKSQASTVKSQVETTILSLISIITLRFTGVNSPHKSIIEFLHAIFDFSAEFIKSICMKNNEFLPFSQIQRPESSNNGSSENDNSTSSNSEGPRLS
uniref:Uncharacterized protein n=1 Tax=Bemisia tabaci nido-like virus 1 TaxID=2840075 RepID=A0A8E8FTD8_9NIDO|nr:hypothetical protein [Bemisia tabaci nido-like virus 1]